MVRADGTLKCSTSCLAKLKERAKLTEQQTVTYQTAKDLLIDLKRLKQKQEIEAELERSVSPDTISGATNFFYELPVQLTVATQAAARTSAFFIPAVYRGRMLTFVWKKFSGSYFLLRSRSRL
jgi:hypothetical protein